MRSIPAGEDRSSPRGFDEHAALPTAVRLAAWLSAATPTKEEGGKIVLLIALIVVLIAGGITATVLIKRSTDQPNNAAESSGRAEDNSPPEQNLLVQSITSGSVNYGTTPTFDACAVLPFSALEAARFPSMPKGVLEHQYMPSSVPPENATVSNAVEKSSRCYYSAVEGQGEKISFNISQAPFSIIWGARQNRDGEVESSSAGLQVFTKNPEQGEYHARILQKGTRFEADLHAHNLATSYNGVDAKIVFTKVIDVVAANLAKGPGERSTDSFTGRYADVPQACDVLTSELFTQLTSSKDSGLVQFESRLSEMHDSITMSLEQKCWRRSPEEISSTRNKGNSLRIVLETYRDENMAKQADNCDPNSKSRQLLGAAVPVNEKIGDGAACVFVIGSSPNFAFRVGRTEVKLIAYSDWADKSPENYAKKLAPAAKTVAEQVRGKIK